MPVNGHAADVKTRAKVRHQHAAELCPGAWIAGQVKIGLRPVSELLGVNDVVAVGGECCHAPGDVLDNVG